MRKLKALLILGLLLGSHSFAQVIPGGGPVSAGPSSSIIGNLQTATGGTVGNGTLSFTLSQPAVVSGTASLAATTESCYTATDGHIVGVPDPLVAPVLSVNPSTLAGTLPAGTYYVEFTYVNASGESNLSPEATVILPAQGAVIVNAPAIQPAAATGFFNVYIGNTSGGETLMGEATGWSGFAQTTPIIPGNSPPLSNTSSCNIYFSDQLVPTGTSYSVGLFNKNGSKIAGFPQTWCTYGGAGSTINVSSGAPTGNCGTNGVYYPTPIFANPPNNSQQSVSGRVSFPGGVNVSGNSSLLGGVTGMPKADGVCYVDGFVTTSIAQAVNCAGSAGTIEVPPAAGVVSVPASITIPAGVTLKVDQGAVLSVASGQTLTIAGPLSAGLYSIFSGSGTVSFTSPGNDAISRPEWWGAKADGTLTVPVTGTDNLSAFNSALAALPAFALPSQGTYLLPNGQLARTGKLLLAPGRYVVSGTLQWSPFVSYECPSYLGCPIVLRDGAAASGPEKWVIDIQPVPSGSNATFGTQFKNISVDCNGGVVYGSNTFSSGVRWLGAQGSSMGSLEVGNCGQRGIWLFSSGSGGSLLSGANGENNLWATQIGAGPGIQLDAGVSNFATVRAEEVNSTCLSGVGPNLDADGDCNPGVLIGSAISNGAVNLTIANLGTELDGLPCKIWSGNGIVIENPSMSALAGGQPTFCIISHGARGVTFGPLFTFASSPNLFTNAIVDRTTTPTTTIPFPPGNFPFLRGYPLPVVEVGSPVDLTAQTAAVGTTTLYTVGGYNGQYRLTWNAKVTTAAGSSSTLGALTIVYTDPDSVVQTITAPASVAAGTIATTSAGNTTGTVLLGLPLMLNCKAGTAITYAFAYASNAANAMNYNLHLKLEAQ